MDETKDYGKELILDLHDCNPGTFNRRDIEQYMIDLCDAIKMERCELFFWDDVGLSPEECQTDPHLKGTSAVQFILTSNITIHTLDILKRVYINVFSCKDFDVPIAILITVKAFGGRVVHSREIPRV